MKQSQTAKIYKALKAGRKLTMASMFSLCGTLNGHKRCAEVARQYGVTLDIEKVEHKGRIISQWSLA